DLNTVNAASDSVLVQAHLSLAGTVNDPETGLAKAHGLITDLNTVNAASDSALVQAHLSLAGTVNDPVNGLEATGQIVEQQTVELEKLDDDLTVLTSRADVLEAAVRADQVLPNGDFADGDMRGWADVPASFLVRPRQAGGPAALDAAPTPFVLELAHNLASQRAAAVKHVPVRGGEQFRASLQAAAAASGDAVLVVRMAFYGADGGYMSAVERNAWVAGHIWTLFDLGSITAPVGAQSAWIWLRRNAGGTGNAYAADIRVERVSSAQTEALARITNLEATRVTASGAVAAIETEISASFGGLTAMASATAFAKAQADKISAGYVWKLNGANVFEMVSVSDGTAGPVTTARIAADYIRLTGLSQISEAVIEELAVSNALVQNFTAAEASVGTLEIAGNAVTVPARAFRGELIEITSPTAWTTLVSLTIDRAGFATDLTFAAMLDGYGSGVVELGFWRDGVLIQTAHQATAPDGRQSHVSVTVSDFNLGTGQTVYSVTARKLDGTKTGGWSARMRLAKRRLNAIQYKR
ncbi:MAG: hypothetical protein MRY77_15520, partial [Rhodobacteraceae bacterium]|nr:hypothetical protein [Paracoccaceae bacterium]